MKNIILTILTLGLAISSVFMSGVNSFAEENNNEEKVVEVPIQKEYKSAKFTMQFDYYDDYIVTVKSPDGLTFNGALTSENTCECVANNVTPGQWKVIIKKAEKETSTDSNEEGEIIDESKEETSEEVERPISPVKITLEGSFETLADVDSNITVATDIIGLQMYFVDEKFVAKWTDTTCGNVNVKIVNSKNLQTIASETVKERSFTYAIKPEVEEIMVTIVPSVSSSVKGAEKTYSFVTKNEPDVEMSYEDLLITNHDSIKLTATLNKKYSLKIYVNDTLVDEQTDLGLGTHDLEIPLEVGSNNIVTYVIDPETNYMKTFPYKLDKDVVAPQLELISTYDDIRTTDEYLNIEGKVTDFNTLFINSAEIEVEGDSTFKYDYKLKEGINQIAVIATDEAGNETEYDIIAEKYIPEKKSSLSPGIIFILIAVGALVFIIILSRKRKKQNEAEVIKDRPAQKKEKASLEYEKVDISKMSSHEKQKLVRGPSVVCDYIGILIPLMAILIVMLFVLNIGVVQSGSMEPRLNVGNTIFYNRLAYKLTEPQRGDIVLFYNSEYGEYFSKRIIGIPGDHIEFRDGYTVINGQYCDESDYIASTIETNSVKEFDVPENCYFMMGDNREFSNDSRYWQQPYISRNAIVGKYMGQIDFSIQYDILNRFSGASGSRR